MHEFEQSDAWWQMCIFLYIFSNTGIILVQAVKFETSVYQTDHIFLPCCRPYPYCVTTRTKQVIISVGTIVFIIICSMNLAFLFA